jgi:esterase/lipase superfamily enzyme
MMTTVYFATNRKPLEPFVSPWFEFDPAPLTPDGLLFAEAMVSGTDIAQQDSGTIDAIASVSAGTFSAASRTALTNSTKDLLIFIHGFANGFEAAIKRAAYNREWLAESGLPAADMDILAFTWPSSDSVISVPPNFPDDAYLADQGRASKSGYHLAHFLNEISKLFIGFDPAAKRRVLLLAHSMGNWALEAGVEAFFYQVPTPLLSFDEVVLAAADEVATSFETPDGGRLSRLPEISKRISVYYNDVDVAMFLSMAVNRNNRLGKDGADNKIDTTLYPPDRFRNVDCTSVDDYNKLEPIDATHQYYRRSPIVRADIAALIGGEQVAPGVSSLPMATA